MSWLSVSGGTVDSRSGQIPKYSSVLNTEGQGFDGAGHVRRLSLLLTEEGGEGVEWRERGPLTSCGGWGWKRGTERGTEEAMAACTDDRSL